MRRMLCRLRCFCFVWYWKNTKRWGGCVDLLKRYKSCLPQNNSGLSTDFSCCFQLSLFWSLYAPLGFEQLRAEKVSLIFIPPFVSFSLTRYNLEWGHAQIIEYDSFWQSMSLFWHFFSATKKQNEGSFFVWLLKEWDMSDIGMQILQLKTVFWNNLLHLVLQTVIDSHSN